MYTIKTLYLYWHSSLDVIAIDLRCCYKYSPSSSCHELKAKEEHEVYPKTAFSRKAILCGVCCHEISINDYLTSSNTFPNCKASFNPC